MSPRRPQGEGSVYRLPDGRWRGVVDLGWHGGRRRRKYITRRAQADVVRELRRLTAAAEAGRLSVERTPTLGQWLARYLDEVAASSVRPSSLRRYRQEVRLYIEPALGKVPLDKLKPSQISDFYRSQLRHLSPGSVRRLHALLRRSLAVAVRWQLTPWNPVAAVDAPSVASVEVHPYDVNEARLLLAAASGDRFHARWLIAIALGLRQSEALGLAWRDVDLDQRVVFIRQTLQYRPGDGFHLVPPKTARSRRIVPLPDAVVESLKLRRERQEADRLAVGADFWEDWGLVFTTGFGTPLSPRNDYRGFRRLANAAGLRRVRLHDLRHTAASLMLAQGVNPRVVMEILGHSQISITMNTYSHVTPASSREAVARVEDLLFGGRPSSADDV
jgi:integrase